MSAAAIPEFNPEVFVDPVLIRMAEQALADVKAGKFVALGVIGITPHGQITSQTQGAHVPLYVGCEIMKGQLMNAIAPPIKPSNLLRPV